MEDTIKKITSLQKLKEYLIEVCKSRIVAVKQLFDYEYTGDKVEVIQDREINFTDNDLSNSLNFLNSHSSYSNKYRIFTKGEISEENPLILDDIEHKDTSLLLRLIANHSLDMSLYYNNFSIIVHFPNVTVSNEQNLSTIIYDLFVKVSLNIDCTYSYTHMCRSTFTYAQFMSGYVHSHLPRIQIMSDNPWRKPCFGSGPLSSTSEWLREYSEEAWSSFVYELSSYVKVESIDGGPYIRIDNIGNSSNIGKPFFTNTIFCITHNKIDWDIPMREKDTYDLLLNKFLKYYIENYTIKFAFKDGAYTLGENVDTFALNFSQAFGKWYNEARFNDNIPYIRRSEYMDKAIYYNGLLYTLGSNSYKEDKVKFINNYNKETSPVILTFKNKEIRLKITDIKKIEPTTIVYIIKPQLLRMVLNKMSVIINYYYGKQSDSTSTGRHKFCYI